MRRSFLVLTVLLAGSRALLATDYKLLATPTTIEWGHYAVTKPAITVKSGDTVTIQTLSTCGSTDRLVARGIKREDIPAYNDAIYKANIPASEKGPGGHILTGPVAIDGAEPGDVLEVQILKIDLDANFACNGFGLHHGFCR